MGLPVEAIVGILVGGIAVLVFGRKIVGNSQPVERDETVNNEYNVSYGGRSRRNRKSRRR